MGIILRTSNTNFDEVAVSFIPPVSDGLEYWGYFGSPARAARNLAPGKPGATVVGSPTYGSGFAGLSKTGYVQTAVPDLPQSTMIAVFKPQADQSSFIVGSGPVQDRPAPFTGFSNGNSLYTNTATGGDSIVSVRHNRSHFNGASGAATGTIASTNSPNISNWMAYAGSYDGALKRVRIQNLASGTTVDATPTAPNDVVDLTVATYRIGYGYTDTLGTLATDIAFVAIYDRPLTAQELADVYGHAQAYLLDRFGLAV